ncbi:MAG: hypothetical protein JXA33_04355 [Anaerolineae bacterium]|nr:hypothetical protein [Anaerolineae bacterium]
MYTVCLKEPRAGDLPLRVRALSHVAGCVMQVVQPCTVAQFAQAIAPVQIAYRAGGRRLRQYTTRRRRRVGRTVQRVARGLSRDGE